MTSSSRLGAGFLALVLVCCLTAPALAPAAATEAALTSPKLILGFEREADLNSLELLLVPAQPSSVAIVREEATEGDHSLQVSVSPAGVELRFLLGQQVLTGVYALSFDLVSDASEPMGVTGYVLGRYPRPAASVPALPYERLIRPGENRVFIRQPAESGLNLTRAQLVTILQLPGRDEPYTVHLDNVRLMPQPAQATAIIKGPYLQNLSPTSVTLMWETDGPGDSSFTMTSDRGGAKAYVSERRTVHQVTVPDLAPGTEYVYAVRSGDAASERFTFRTAPAEADALRFAVYGDTRTQPLEHWRVAEAIRRSRPEFVLHTGDLVASGPAYDYWESDFFQPACDLLATTCLFPVPGNHEAEAHWYYDFVAPPGDVESWYDFRWGPAYFLALDSEKPFDPTSEQYAWLRQRLTSEACRQARWHFAFWHQPAYSSGSHGGSEALRQHVVPLLVEAGFDMVFAGHDHCYERSHADGLYHITAGGGGAPLYEQEPVDEEGKPRNPASQAFVTAYHFCLVEADGNTLVLTALTPDGKVIDRVTVTKGSPSRPDDESSLPR